MIKQYLRDRARNTSLCLVPREPYMDSQTVWGVLRETLEEAQELHHIK
jgi:hypothetical protein